MGPDKTLDLLWRKECSAGDTATRCYTADCDGMACTLTVTDEADGFVSWELSAEPVRSSIPAPSLKMTGRDLNDADACRSASAYVESVTLGAF